jgi:hypothetical protein
VSATFQTSVIRCTLCQRITTVPNDALPHCADCRRRVAYGAIVDVLCSEVDEPPFARWTLDALDALALIMIDRHRLIAAHRKELNDEIKAAQRESTASYREGMHDGQMSAREDW